MLLSRGDLILIYSRVPNKLVFAVVTSALFPPLLFSPLLSSPLLSSPLLSSPLGPTCGPRNLFGTSWRLDAYNAPLSRPKPQTLPLLLDPLFSSWIFLRNLRSALRGMAAGSSGIRIYKLQIVRERVALVAPTCRCFVPFFFSLLVYLLSSCRSSDGKRKRGEERGLGTGAATDTRNTLASTPVAYNCQLARGYLIAIRLGGELTIWARPDLGPPSPPPPFTPFRPRYLHDRAGSA